MAFIVWEGFSYPGQSEGRLAKTFFILNMNNVPYTDIALLGFPLATGDQLREDLFYPLFPPGSDQLLTVGEGLFGHSVILLF